METAPGGRAGHVGGSDRPGRGVRDGRVRGATASGGGRRSRRRSRHRHRREHLLHRQQRYGLDQVPNRNCQAGQRRGSDRRRVRRLRRQSYRAVRRGRGAVWYATRTGTTWSSWSSLGKPTGLTVTAEPGAVARGATSGNYSVYARASDGNIWVRDHNASGWGAWHKIGAPAPAVCSPAPGPPSPTAAASASCSWSAITPTQMYHRASRAERLPHDRRIRLHDRHARTDHRAGRTGRVCPRDRSPPVLSRIQRPHTGLALGHDQPHRQLQQQPGRRERNRYRRSAHRDRWAGHRQPGLPEHRNLAWVPGPVAQLHRLGQGHRLTTGCAKVT